MTVRHKRPRLQLFVLNFALGGGPDVNVSKGNTLTCFKITTNEKSEKTNFSWKVVPVELDFTVAKDTTMVAMNITKASCKITSIKIYRSWIHNTTMTAILIPSCKWHDVGSSYLRNKPVINSEYNI